MNYYSSDFIGVFVNYVDAAPVWSRHAHARMLFLDYIDMYRVPRLLWHRIYNIAIETIVPNADEAEIVPRRLACRGIVSAKNVEKEEVPTDSVTVG